VDRFPIFGESAGETVPFVIDKHTDGGNLLFDKRSVLQQAAHGNYIDRRLLASSDLCEDELALFRSLRDRGIFRGDMYEYVSSSEVTIHRVVRQVLEHELGSGEDGWWRKVTLSSFGRCIAGSRELPSA
jgi:hypothetical protein